ncbi:type II toxin-antitoxin system death-on-curing family toxin [Candidatus Daviesbacteria bacterium]|nr:type II toxin-antitoxin system death-on-curing family toxin [Candidatus Daviesbacteria bacterium]
MKYLSVKDVLLLHNMAVDESGGSHGLRDLGLLESAVARPQASFGGEDLYPDIFLKTGALIHVLLRNHPFVDGNKRTSMFSAMTFLELNGYLFNARQKEVVKFALKVENRRGLFSHKLENEKLSVEKIAKWLKEHAKKKV